MENSLIKNKGTAVINLEKKWDKDSLLAEIINISGKILDLYDEINDILVEHRRKFWKISLFSPFNYSAKYDSIEFKFNCITETMNDVLLKPVVSGEKELIEILDACQKIFEEYKVLYGRLIGREIDEYEIEKLYRKKRSEYIKKRSSMGLLP